MAATADSELVWASALFCGEGCASILRGTRSKIIYPSMSLLMQDKGAVERFARAISPHIPARTRRTSLVGLSVKQVLTQRGKKAWVVRVSGTPAEHAFAVMLPHLEGTEKGKQIRKVLREVKKTNACNR